MAGQWWDNSGFPWNPTGSGDPSSAGGFRNDYSIPLTVGTQVTSPVSGIVLPASSSGALYSAYGKQPWGGEVDVLTSMPNYPGVLQVVDVLHFDTINVQPGDIVTQGQTVLGTSGGQTSGGNMPSSPQFSQGPHIGVGVHAVRSFSQLYDPSLLVNGLRSNAQQSSVPSQTQMTQYGLPPIPFGPILPTGGNPLSQFQSTYRGLSTWLAQPIRIGKLLLGMALIAGAWTLFLFSQFGPELGAAAVTAAGAPEAAPAVQRTLSRGKTPPIKQAKAGIQAGGALIEQRTRREREFREQRRREQEQRQTKVLVERERAKEYGRVTSLVNDFFRAKGREGGQKAAANRRQRAEAKATKKKGPGEEPLKEVDVSAYFQQKGPGTSLFEGLKERGAFKPEEGKE